MRHLHCILPIVHVVIMGLCVNLLTKELVTLNITMYSSYYDTIYE